jgi:glycosyltransferase involved in cell wall biosynthesis
VKILYVVTNSDLGGAPRVVTELSARAVRDGHICAVAASPGGPMWDGLDPRIEQIPVPSMRRAVDPAQDLKTFLFLRSLYLNYSPDIVHLHSSKAGAIGRLAAIASGGGLAKRCVYTIHGFDTILKTHRKYLPLERFLSKHSGVVVPVSSYDNRSVRESGLSGRIVLIHNGVTDRLGLPSPDAKAVQRLEAAKSRGRPVILTIARLEAPKRPDLFLEVARRLPEASFFWVGNVGMPISTLPTGTIIPKNAEFLGESPEAGNLANLCEIFLLLSDYEGLPMSILEAMSCGTSIVGSDVGGIAEALGVGAGKPKAGLLVPNEADAVTAAIRSILDNSASNKAMAQAARTRYLAEFSADRMWAAYENLYRTLITA